MPIHIKRLAKRRGDPVRESLSISGLTIAKLDDGELVPTESRERVYFANAGSQPVGYGDQKSIADGMAQSVVNLLEIIQIEADHRELRSSTRHGDGLFHAFAEQQPVGQFGQRIMTGHECDAL